MQWSFIGLKQEHLEMLASQAETGVWVQAPGKGVLGRVREGVAPPAAGVRGITSGKKI